MHHVIAEAHPNIALVKYWGKRDALRNLPSAGSLSITLDAFTTRTEVWLDSGLGADDVELNGRSDGAARIAAFIALFRQRSGRQERVRVRTRNDFPTAAGLASSASGFAALTVALDRAYGLGLAAAELSVLARQGSGSAARSIFGGFAEMVAGVRPDGNDAHAHPVLAPDAWPLEVAIAITTHQSKSVASGDGMKHTEATSPYYRAWVETAKADLPSLRSAVLARDFDRVAAIAEGNCLAMHAVMMSARPGLLYWNAASIECMHRVRALRAAGIPVFFTIDAGPQVKAVCLPGYGAVVADGLRGIPGVEQVVLSGLGLGAKVVAS